MLLSRWGCRIQTNAGATRPPKQELCTHDGSQTRARAIPAAADDTKRHSRTRPARTTPLAGASPPRPRPAQPSQPARAALLCCVVCRCRASSRRGWISWRCADGGQGCGLRLAASHTRNRCPTIRLPAASQCSLLTSLQHMPPFARALRAVHDGAQKGAMRCSAVHWLPWPSGCRHRGPSTTRCAPGLWLALTDVCGHGPQDTADAHGRPGPHVYRRSSLRRAAPSTTASACLMLPIHSPLPSVPLTPRHHPISPSPFAHCARRRVPGLYILSTPIPPTFDASRVVFRRFGPHPSASAPLAIAKGLGARLHISGTGQLSTRSTCSIVAFGSAF